MDGVQALDALRGNPFRPTTTISSHWESFGSLVAWAILLHCSILLLTQIHCFTISLIAHLFTLFLSHSISLSLYLDLESTLIVQWPTLNGYICRYMVFSYTSCLVALLTGAHLAAHPWSACNYNWSHSMGFHTDVVLFHCLHTPCMSAPPPMGSTFLAQWAVHLELLIINFPTVLCQSPLSFCLAFWLRLARGTLKLQLHLELKWSKATRIY